MKATLILLFSLGGLAIWLGSGSAPTGGETFTVRLIRGSDQPATVADRPLEPGLARRLGLVFRWPCYLEQRRGTVIVPPGGSVRVRLDSAIEARLQLGARGRAEYAVTVDGGVVRRGAGSSGQRGPWLAGIERPGTNAAWFVAIERNAPSTPTVLTRFKPSVEPWPPGARAPISPVAARPAIR